MVSDFFFYLYGYHGDLDSFPTRRSSDLADRGRQPRQADRALVAGERARAAQRGRARAGARSEEHTSELQSRQYLVCRLLLEKKNENLPILCINFCPRRLLQRLVKVFLPS